MYVTSLRIPDDTAKRLKIHARVRNMTVNAYIMDMLEEQLGTEADSKSFRDQLEAMIAEEASILDRLS